MNKAFDLVIPDRVVQRAEQGEHFVYVFAAFDPRSDSSKAYLGTLDPTLAEAMLAALTNGGRIAVVGGQ